MTEEQCSRFANIFDEDGNGDISKSEFVAFMQFALAMLHCEQQRKAAEAEEECSVEETAESEPKQAPAKTPRAPRSAQACGNGRGGVSKKLGLTMSSPFVTGAFGSFTTNVNRTPVRRSTRIRKLQRSKRK